MGWGGEVTSVVCGVVCGVMWWSGGVVALWSSGGVVEWWSGVIVCCNLEWGGVVRGVV